MKITSALLFCLLFSLPVMATEIALFVPRSETPAWQTQIKFAQAAADDLGVSLRVYNAHNQAQRMLAQVQEACEQGVDGILFMNYEQIGEQILAIAERHKTPGILYNTGFANSDLLPRTKYKTWIGSIIPDDHKAGALLAEQLLQKAEQEKITEVNLMVINGSLTEISAQQRNAGLYQFIKHSSHVQVVAEYNGDKEWSRNEAKRLFVEQYQRNPAINLVWAASDSLALGARDGMAELSIPMDQIIVGGIDWLPEALQTIEQQQTQISVGGHFTEAAWGVILLKDYLEGHDFAVESTQFNSQMYAINHQNLKTFQSFIDDNWQRIDFTALSKAQNSDKLYNFSIKHLLDTYYQNTKPLDLTAEEIAWLKQHDTLRLAIDIDWPPFEYVDERGIYQGIAADYMQLISQRLGITLQPSVGIPWPVVIEASKRRDLDLFSALSITPKRQQFLSFTQPYLSFPMMIITNQKIPYVGDLESLNGQEVAIVKGYASHEWILANHPQIRVFAAGNISEALKAVSSGRVSAYIGNIATVNYVMTREGYTNLKVAGITPYRFELSMAVRSDWPILRNILQKALDSLSEEEKKAIYSRWVTLRYEHGIDYSLVWKVVLAAFLVVAVLSYWAKKLARINHRLNREMKQRKRIERQLRQEKQKIEQLAITDPLTGLFNRRHYDKVLPDEINRMHRNREWLSFVMLDIDCFKQYNDNYGHHNGDQLLVAISKVLQERCHRASDFCFRLGGEEFGLVFSGLSPEHAEVFINDIRHAIEQLQIEHKFSTAAPVLTASFGLVTSNGPKCTMEHFYEAADSALYRAKSNGRNCVEAIVFD